MAIQLFVPTFEVDEVLEGIRECLEKGWTGMGFKTVEFENEWKKYAGLDNAHFLASNTVGLHLALHVLKLANGWSDGDEIIATPLTFVSSNHAILYTNLRPVFADVDDYLCMDPDSLKKRISPRTKAVMFVGMGGNTGQLEEVVHICKQKGLFLILDAAHMSGTKLHGKHVGHEADVTVFSYQAVKNLPTADSGMICFRDQSLDKLARELSWLGINKDTYQRFSGKDGSYRWKYDVNKVGFKYHGNSIQAAIGLVQLKYLDRDNEFRRRICNQYDELISSIPEVKRVEVAPGCTSSRHLYQIVVPKRDFILQNFYENEIFPGVHYSDNTEYPMYQFGASTCPRSHELSKMIISLPLHLRLTDQDCQSVVKTLEGGVTRYLR